MIDLSKGYVENLHTYTFIDVSEVSTDKQEAMIDWYEMLLAKSLICRANIKDESITEDSQEKIFPYIKCIIEWLRTTDFYSAPASVKYHDACPSGLLRHTLEAYNQLVNLRTVPKFREVVKTQWWSAVFVILVHDWCKIGRYESYLKNVKNDDTGRWDKVPAYKYSENGTGRLGHGTQSLIMAMQLCNNKFTALSFEEMAAIRWHMDNWDMSNYDIEDLKICNERIPMVRMVQFADQLAITSY